MILTLIAIGDWWGGVCKWLHKRGRAHSDIGSHLSFGSRFKGLRHHKWASLDLWQRTCFWGHFCIISLVVFTIVLTTIIKCITSSTTSSSFPTCVTSSVAWLGTWSSSWSELSGVSGNIRELFSTWKFSVLLVALDIFRADQSNKIPDLWQEWALWGDKAKSSWGKHGLGEAAHGS